MDDSSQTSKRHLLIVLRREREKGRGGGVERKSKVEK